MNSEAEFIREVQQAMERHGVRVSVDEDGGEFVGKDGWRVTPNVLHRPDPPIQMQSAPLVINATGTVTNPQSK